VISEEIAGVKVDCLAFHCFSLCVHVSGWPKTDQCVDEERMRERDSSHVSESEEVSKGMNLLRIFFKSVLGFI
jgi:hypothetical protein